MVKVEIPRDVSCARHYVSPGSVVLNYGTATQESSGLTTVGKVKMQRSPLEWLQRRKKERDVFYRKIDQGPTYGLQRSQPMLSMELWQTAKDREKNSSAHFHIDIKPKFIVDSSMEVVMSFQELVTFILDSTSLSVDNFGNADLSHLLPDGRRSTIFKLSKKGIMVPREAIGLDFNPYIEKWQGGEFRCRLAIIHDKGVFEYALPIYIQDENQLYNAGERQMKIGSVIIGLEFLLKEADRLAVSMNRRLFEYLAGKTEFAQTMFNDVVLPYVRCEINSTSSEGILR